MGKIILKNEYLTFLTLGQVPVISEKGPAKESNDAGLVRILLVSPWDLLEMPRGQQWWQLMTARFRSVIENERRLNGKEERDRE